MSAATWSESYPGTILPGCGSTEGALEVHHQTGRMLRIGSEARLCFECGPDGGVYHPDEADMASIRTLAAAFDAEFNRFETHEHAAPVSHVQRVDHSHTDGSEPHRHEGFGPASFTITTEEKKVYGLGGPGGKRRWTKKPEGESHPYVELTDDERTFKVVFHYVYANAGTRGGKPDPRYSRATWRAADLYVQASRQPGSVVVGPGAIPMAAVRMMLTFRIEPIYAAPDGAPRRGGAGMNTAPSAFEEVAQDWCDHGQHYVAPGTTRPYTDDHRYRACADCIAAMKRQASFDPEVDDSPDPVDIAEAFTARYGDTKLAPYAAEGR